MMTPMEEYYNKFNEDKRLNSRHGHIEFVISMKYIHEYLDRIMEEREIEKKAVKILDLGAGTGRYAIPLYEEGYDVTAVEPVKHSLGVMRKNCPGLNAFQGNAKKLRRLASDTFDLTICFGPMYHLVTKEDRVKALLEAKRVTKPGGIIMIAYIMNEYSVVTYAFKEKHVLDCLLDGRLSDDWHSTPVGEDFYYYARTEDIEELNQEAGLTRLKIFSPDGPANYMRPFLNALSDKEYEAFIAYQMSVCERTDLLGAAAHTVDVVTL